MRYAFQVWGLCDNVACHRILTLQKCALRLITFSAPRSSSNPILGFLKFLILLKILNILFDHQIFYSNLPTDLLNTFDFSNINHSINIMGSCLCFLKYLQSTLKLKVVNSTVKPPLAESKYGADKNKTNGK